MLKKMIVCILVLGFLGCVNSEIVEIPNKMRVFQTQTGIMGYGKDEKTNLVNEYILTSSGTWVKKSSKTEMGEIKRFIDIESKTFIVTSAKIFVYENKSFKEVFRLNGSSRMERVRFKRSEHSVCEERLEVVSHMFNHTEKFIGFVMFDTSEGRWKM